MTSYGADSKASSERAVFMKFAEHLGEAELWESVESTQPPMPDLLCVHRVLGPKAFELVAITDPLIARVNAGKAKHGVSQYWTSDPTERIIRKKLGRTYQSEHPIELLIYNDLLVITPDDIIIEIAVNWLGSINHQFRQVWFMSEFEAKSVWKTDF